MVVRIRKDCCSSNLHSQSKLALHLLQNFHNTYLLASERSERDTYRGNTIENRGCLFIYLYICMDVRKAFLYFDPRVFVLAMWSTPSQIALNRILTILNSFAGAVKT